MRLGLAIIVLLGQCAIVHAQAKSPREMLQIMQIDESYLRFFQDDMPVQDENEALQKLLFRIPSFAQVHLDRWSKEIDDVTIMMANPDSYRFEMHLLKGEVVNVLQIDVLPEMVPRLGFQYYYEVTLAHDGVESLVFVRTIPKRWQTLLNSENENGLAGQTVRVQAMLLKRGSRNDKRTLVFAANRLNWHPSNQSSELGIGQEQVLLGQLGVDIDRLAHVTHKSTTVDRESFYQTLAAVRHTEPEILAKMGRRTFDIARFIQKPQQASSELYTLHGLARRALSIRVEDADIQERFGIDHYYEIEVFMPMEKQVRFVDPDKPADQKGKVFTDYPFVVCVPELPPGMQQGDDIREPITFSAFFIQLWAYRTEFMSADQGRTDKPRLQHSPLFVGPAVTLGTPGVARKSHLSLIIATLFTSCLLATWLILWRASIKDRLQTQRLFEKHQPTGSFDNLRDLDA